MSEIPEDICSVEGCGQQRHGKGWCKRHYMRWWRHGEPTLGSKTYYGDPQRYFHEVVLKYEGDECLTWPYGKDSWGYAHLRKDGRQQLAHRLVCEIVNGPAASPQLEAAHTCGNGRRGCVSPKHIAWKTRIENEQDKLVHGTRARGSRVFIYTQEQFDTAVLDERESATKVERDRLAGWIAYELTRRMVIDMPTARAAVDAAIRSGEESGK